MRHNPPMPRDISDALLANLQISVAHTIVGRSPAEFFALVTGIHRKRWDRGTALEALRERILGSGEDVHTALLLQLMAPPGEPTRQVPRGACAGFSGICAVFARGLGVLDEDSSQATWDVIAALDAADMLLYRALENDDLDAFRRQFVPGTVLSPDYLAPLDVTEQDAHAALPYPDRQAARLIQRRRAHMALSYLACVDHELERRIGGQKALAVLSGRSRLAMLIAEPAPVAGQRLRPDDPLARLVDLAAATCQALSGGGWPGARPSLADMGGRAERSEAIAGDARAFVRKLRSGERPFTRDGLATLVRSQLPAKWPKSSTDEAVRLFIPFLHAAHYLTALMPRLPGTSMRLDRTGWRAAYVTWWERHAPRYPAKAPVVPAPGWLAEP